MNQKGGKLSTDFQQCKCYQITCIQSVCNNNKKYIEIKRNILKILKRLIVKEDVMGAVKKKSAGAAIFFLTLLISLLIYFMKRIRFQSYILNYIYNIYYIIIIFKYLI